MIDSHGHIHFEHFDADREAVFERAWAAGLEGMVLVGTDLATSRRVLEFAHASPRLRATVGVHPHDAAGCDAATRGALLDLAQAAEVVALGETGLDFFRDHSPRDAQRQVFEWHLDAARDLGKPVVIHSRDATAEMRERLATRPKPLCGVMHCFSGDVDDALFYCGLGLYISFAGQVTYPKNEALRAAARAVPLERLLIETDAPYLTPQAVRGRRNEPAYLVHTLSCIAKERGLTPQELAEATTANTRALFAWDLSSGPGPA